MRDKSKKNQEESGDDDLGLGEDLASIAADLSDDNDVEDEDVEDINIDEVEQGFNSSNTRRRLIFLSLAIACSGGVYFIFSKDKHKKIKDPLNSLAYEAMALEEDRSGDRLNLPSREQVEIEQYFESSHDLKFHPRTLSPLPRGWIHDGASMIDYEIAKIAVVQMSDSNSDHMLFLFTLAGKLDDLEGSETGDLEGFSYRPYASDRINIVSWQDDPKTLAVLMGHQSILDLAKYARRGSVGRPQTNSE